MVQNTSLPLGAKRGWTKTHRTHQAAIEQAIQLMHQHLQEPLQLEDLADVACLSPYYFCRLFHSIIGIPPKEFLAALRLERAKRLLLTTTLSVTDICFEVGYTGLGSFTSRFTQHVGVSPRHLRQLTNSHIVPAQRVLATQPPHRDGCPPGLSGHIATPETFNGPIFVGLFPKPIPTGKPAGCTVLFSTRSYYIDPVPDGIYYIMVAAFSQSTNLQTYLLPGTAPLVGSYGPVCIHHGKAQQRYDIVLRPISLTDPPILTAFPYL